MATDPTFIQSAPAEDASMSGGITTYFAPPHLGLDPILFDGDHLKPVVRNYVLSHAKDGMRSLGLQDPDKWLYVWISGSSMSYSYEVTGDMDVTLGANMAEFARANPEWAGMNSQMVSAIARQHFREAVHPFTEAANFGGKIFDVTFFWNADIPGDQIQEIHPYAAYDITHDRWAVHPVRGPADKTTKFKPEWYQAAGKDTELARDITDRYEKLLTGLRALPAGSAGWHTTGAMLNLAISQASSLLEDIHNDRATAFRLSGKGGDDWGNFRWQSGVINGVVKSMTAISTTGKNALEAEQAKLYGAPITPADRAIQEAIAVHRKLGA